MISSNIPPVPFPPVVHYS